MINFSIPGIQESYKLNLAFIDYFQKYKERFYDNVNIENVFGNFQFCIFDGGRIFYQTKQASKEFVEKLTSLYNDKNIPIRLVFTNNQLKPEHYYDKFSNLVLKICSQSGINEIVLNDDNLLKYIQDNYNGFKFISSTTKCIKNLEETLKELENPNYSKVCLNYNFNKEFNWLNSLPQNLKDKCEFLINAICPSNCPERKRHYELNSIYSLQYGKPYNQLNCQLHKSTLYPDISNNNFTLEEIVNYHNCGFSHFKIEGRTLNEYEIILNYLKYMIKPKWQYETYHAIQIMKEKYE